VSFGVGYRKDYQMERWIGWLDMALPVEPALAPDRLAVFAAAVAGTEDMTEGRGTRSAALALVRSCMAVSPRRAFRLIRFFEEHGCIDYASAIGVILDVAVERSMCRPVVVQAALTKFLVMFSTHGHSELTGR